jgi:uncharacterized iron-regulated membrane protein
MIAPAVFALVAAAFVALSRWGQRNLDQLVPAHYSPERRAKDERSIRRGARSCFAIGILFALFSVALATGQLVDQITDGSP